MEITERQAISSKGDKPRAFCMACGNVEDDVSIDLSRLAADSAHALGLVLLEYPQGDRHLCPLTGGASVTAVCKLDAPSCW